MGKSGHLVGSGAAERGKMLCIAFYGPFLRLPCHGIVNEAMSVRVAPQDVVGPHVRLGSINHLLSQSVTGLWRALSRASDHFWRKRGVRGGGDTLGYSSEGEVPGRRFAVFDILHGYCTVERGAAFRTNQVDQKFYKKLLLKPIFKGAASHAQLTSIANNFAWQSI